MSIREYYINPGETLNINNWAQDNNIRITAGLSAQDTTNSALRSMVAQKDKTISHLQNLLRVLEAATDKQPSRYTRGGELRKLNGESIFYLSCRGLHVAEFQYRDLRDQVVDLLNKED